MVDKKGIQKILRASISFIQPATRSEKGLFPVKRGNLFYTFGLSSGQVFVAHIPEKVEQFTLRTLEGPLPQLREIHWQRLDSVSDLNYHTSCVFSENASPTEQKVCLSALRPRRNYDRGEPTKIAFKYYIYHPILERMICLQQAHQAYQVAQILAAERKMQIQNLLISKNKPKLNQQQTKGEKQHVRN